MGAPVVRTNTDAVENVNGSGPVRLDSPLVVSTDGSALGNPNAEPSKGKTTSLSLGEVSDPNGSRQVRLDSPLVVSTDGSALGNPNGPMGWGWVDHQGGRHDAGGASNGTNQIGELCAVLQALRAHRGSQDLIIESDSQYAINCSTKWVHGWKKNGWKNAKKQSVKNAPLIKAIDAELSARPASVKFKWVKGHAGNEFNEKVDDLAHGYATHIGEGRKEGYLPLEGWQSLLESPYAEGTDIPEDVKLALAGKKTLPSYELDEQYSDSSSSSASDSASDSDSDSSLSDSSSTQTSSAPALQESSSSHETLDSQTPEVSQGKQQTTPTPHAETSLKDPSEPSSTRRKPQLQASGTIRLSPPPSSSKRYSGVPLRVCGTLHIDAAIDAEGYVDVNGSIFTMDWFSAGEQQNA